MLRYLLLFGNMLKTLSLIFVCYFLVLWFRGCYVLFLLIWKHNTYDNVAPKTKRNTQVGYSVIFFLIICYYVFWFRFEVQQLMCMTRCWWWLVPYTLFHFLCPLLEWSLCFLSDSCADYTIIIHFYRYCFVGVYVYMLALTYTVAFSEINIILGRTLITQIIF